MTLASATAHQRVAGDPDTNRPITMATTDTRPAIVQMIGSFQGGGAQRLALNLAEAIAARGHRSIAVALRSAGAFVEKDVPQGVEVNSLSAARDSGLSVLRAARRLRRCLIQSNASILHVHGAGCLIVAAVAMMGWKQRPRFAFTWHDPVSSIGGTSLRKRATVWALKRCDGLFSPSQEVADRLNAAAEPSRPAEVFINGVPERAESTSIDDPTPRMIWMGRLVAVKEPLMMLRALSRVRAQGGAFECVMAGSALPHAAAFERECRELHASLGLQDCVQMPGWVDDTAGLISRSNIGVQSSRGEGLSMAVLEQMMAGLAVVATDVGDTAQAVRHEQTGLIVPVGDERALADAMLRVVGDPALRARLGRAARSLALTRFSLSAMAERAVATYRELGATV